MRDESKLTLPPDFSSDQAPTFAEAVKSALDLPADARLTFENLSAGPRGQTIVEYSFSQPVQLEGPELGPASGVTVDVPNALTLRFSRKGDLVDHQVKPKDPRYLDAVRANVRNLVARNEIESSTEADAARAIAARKPFYLARDEQGKLRLRRAYMS